MHMVRGQRRYDPDDLVSLSVLAEETGLTDGYIRSLRGKSNVELPLPLPATEVYQRGKRALPVWRWADVEPWVRAKRAR